MSGNGFAPLPRSCETKFDISGRIRKPMSVVQPNLSSTASATVLSNEQSSEAAESQKFSAS